MVVELSQKAHPRVESQSNGEIEENCKTIRGFTKVLKDQIEDETGVKLDGKDNIIQWMIRWGAMLPSRFLVGKDGRTAYERRRGRRCNVPTERFGEKVWYKELKGKSETAGKIESGWREGLWLGHARSSNEIFVGTREGVVRAWAIRKKPYEAQWDGDLVKNMMGTPAQPNPLKASSQVPIRITFEENPDVVVVEGVGPARVEAKPRNTYIQSWMLDVFGYTSGCAGCDVRKAGLHCHRPHTQQCKDRVRAEMEKDDRGKMAKERSDERWKSWARREEAKPDDKKTGEEPTPKGDENKEEEPKDSKKEEEKKEPNIEMDNREEEVSGGAASSWDIPVPKEKPKTVKTDTSRASSAKRASEKEEQPATNKKFKETVAPRMEDVKRTRDEEDDMILADYASGKKHRGEDHDEQLLLELQEQTVRLPLLY